MSVPGVKFRDGWPVQRDNHSPPPGLRRPASGFRVRRVRLHWRGWTALATATALLPAGIVLAELAAHYQPLAYGSSGYTNEYFRGLPTGKGIHLVNTVGGIHQDVYIPPQRGVFSLFLDIANDGPRPVIIEAVTVQRGLALWQAGPARYAWQGQDQPITKPHLLRRVRLGPGQNVFVGIPVRTWSCVSKYGWTSVPFASDMTGSLLAFIAGAWVEGGLVQSSIGRDGCRARQLRMRHGYGRPVACRGATG